MSKKRVYRIKERIFLKLRKNTTNLWRGLRRLRASSKILKKRHNTPLLRRLKRYLKRRPSRKADNRRGKILLSQLLKREDRNNWKILESKKNSSINKFSPIIFSYKFLLMKIKNLFLILFLNFILASLLYHYFCGDLDTQVYYEELYYKPLYGMIFITLFFFSIFSLTYIILSYSLEALSSREQIKIANYFQINFVLFSGVLIQYKIDEIPKHYMFYILMVFFFYFVNYISYLKVAKYKKEITKKPNINRLFLLQVFSISLNVLIETVVDDYLITNSTIFRSELFYVLINDILNTMCIIFCLMMSKDMNVQVEWMYRYEILQFMCRCYSIYIIYQRLLVYQHHIFFQIFMIRLTMDGFKLFFEAIEIYKKIVSVVIVMNMEQRKWPSGYRNCMICLDEIVNGRVTECNHVYHLKCLVLWCFKNHNHNCPVCRKVIRF